MAGRSGDRNRFRERLNEPPGGRPVVIAHRGASSCAPENTLEAARLGWEQEADAWELDVQLTRDGVPVVLHDESLRRTTDVALRYPADPRGEAGFLVADFDLGEIQELDAGSWFLASGAPGRTADGFGTRARLNAEQRRHYASGSVRIPTLLEALRLTAALDWLVNVELKSFPNTSAPLLEAVLAEIDRAGVAERVLLSSFDHADVARAARLRPEIATGVLVSTPLFNPLDYVRQHVGADAFHPSAQVLGSAADAYRRGRSPRVLRVADLDSLRQGGVPVLVYTVNPGDGPGLAPDLFEAGATALFTDDPAGMLALFRDLRRDR
jgi:glycerophosphoryl diester phosphodiesterase